MGTPLGRVPYWMEQPIKLLPGLKTGENEKRHDQRSCLFLARLRRFERPTNGVGGRYSIH